MFDFKELEQDVYTSGRDVRFSEFTEYMYARDCELEDANERVEELTESRVAFLNENDELQKQIACLETENEDLKDQIEAARVDALGDPSCQ